MEQNMLLRHRVETLEGAMQVMKKEMHAVKSALGPWYRTPRHSIGARPTRHRASLRPEGGEVIAEATNGNAGTLQDAPDEGSSNGSSNVQPRVMHTHVQGSGHGRAMPLAGEIVENGGDEISEGAGDPLAGHFPTIGDFGGLLSHNGTLMQQQQQTIGGVGGGPGGLRINPGAVTRVAPLDLGTNLVGTLEGLRESVVGVAAGIDSLGRRSEIALANESLRLGEEVVSMRAAVHGLRMQVCARLC